MDKLKIARKDGQAAPWPGFVPLATPRQARMVALLLQGPVTTKSARDLVGALNVPEVVRQLRHEHGLPVVCNRVSMRDRDGKLTRPGVYSLAPETAQKARALLNIWERRKAANDEGGSSHDE